MNNRERTTAFMDEESIEHVLEALGTPISRHVFDDQLSFIWANTAFYELIGYTRETFLETWKDLKSYYTDGENDITFLTKQLSMQRMQGHTHMNYMLRIPHLQGQLQWVKLTLSIEGTTITISYTLIEDLMKTQDMLNSMQEENKRNFEWLMSEYVGNVYISDMDTYELLYLNKVACETLGARLNEVIGKKCYEAIQGRSSPCPFCTNAYLKKNETYEWEFYNPTLNRNFIIKDQMLNWEGHRARIELSHDTYSMEYKLAKKDQEREAILKTIPAAMVRVDARDYASILWYNDTFLEMIGYTKEQFENELHAEGSYMHPEDLKRAKLLAQDIKKSRESIVFEARVYTREKVERIWTVTLCYISERDSWDGIPCFYSMGLDITDERKKIESLEHKAQKDALTGIYNRLETEEQIKSYIIGEPDRKGVLFMIDTDNFKHINDSMGHIAGDMVLQEMASVMKKQMRENDIVGRIGGDEFTIFMKDVHDLSMIERKAQELLQAFRHLFDKGTSNIQITCSMGAAIYPRDGHTFKELYANADKALYQAKVQGKNSFVLYDVINCTQNDGAQTSLGAAIDSQQNDDHSPDSLAAYAFRILFQSRDLHTAIHMILEVCGKRYDVSRAYIFEVSEDLKHITTTYEWCDKNMLLEKDQRQNVKYSNVSEYSKFFEKNPIFYCNDMQAFNKEQKTLLQAQGISSTLQCAFYEDETFAGLVGFDTCKGKRLWTKDEIRSLTLISQIVSVFLKQMKLYKRMDERQTHS